MGRGRKGRTEFADSAWQNNYTYMQYVNRLCELSISMFDWQGLPDTVDPRYLELKLFENGAVVFFEDEEVGMLALDVLCQGRLDVYGYPYLRRAYSGYNNYQKMLKMNNSVICWNNYLHTNSVLDVMAFARRLYNIDRIIDVNVNAQKTPILVQGNEKQRLTLLNVYKEYDGNAPVIYGDSSLDLSALKVLQTGAPYVADKLYQLKTQIWNEALTYLGISNINIQKKERLITDEVTRNQGGTVASRYSRLNSRREAAEKINQMFGLNVTVDYREDFQNSAQEDDMLGMDTLES